MLARRSFSIAASRVRLPMSEQKVASVVNGVSKVVEAHANLSVITDKAATQKSTGILRNPNMTLTSEAIARGRLAMLDRRTDQARFEQMHADGSLTLTPSPSLTPSLSLTLKPKPNPSPEPHPKPNPNPNPSPHLNPDQAAGGRGKRPASAPAGSARRGARRHGSAPSRSQGAYSPHL